MPAKGEVYRHIYNRGVEKRIIFNDKDDYEVFLSYLKDYLSSPPDPETTKKHFTVNGKAFRGTPHQPKNYLGKVKLVAYSLMPTHFHLLLHEVDVNSIENFMRSLLTRYSIYFNKKYKRTGSLFQGPYKSADVEDTYLPLLTRFLHGSGGYTSYEEYLGKRSTSWVKPIVIKNYKDFVEKYKTNQDERKILEKMAFETEEEHANEHLERTVLARSDELTPPTSAVVTENSHKPKVFEFGLATIIFFLLLGVGLNNIHAAESKNIASAVLSESTIATPTPSESPVPKIMVTIKITDGAESVNIREKADITSEIIGKAADGQKFEFISNDEKWYEVKLSDGSIGFISVRYIEKEETND